MSAAHQCVEAHGLRGDAIPSPDYPGDDLLIVSFDPPGERQALKKVREPVGVEHHGDDVRRIGLITGDQLLREHVHCSALVGLQAGKPKPRGVELLAQSQQLGAFGGKVGLEPSDLALESGDAGIQLSQAAVVSANCSRERRDPVLAGADLLHEIP